MIGIDIDQLRKEMGTSARPHGTVVKNHATIAMVTTSYIPSDKAFWGYVMSDGRFDAMGIVSREVNVRNVEQIEGYFGGIELDCTCEGDKLDPSCDKHAFGLVG